MAQGLYISIVGDASSYLKALRQAATGTSRFSREVGRSTRGGIAATGIFQGMGRSIAFASSAFLGGYGLTAAVRSAFEEMSNAEQATADMNAALKSTHGVANVTAKQIDTMATSLMNLSGVDDELIKQSETLLLTFTRIRNYAGKNNDIFNQATKAALDLSVRFKQDLPTSAKLVGKALNDPIRGLTALRRVGVSFSDAQAKMIKRLVESGNILGAQKIILRELRVETGGAARALGDTLGGKLNILRNNLLNVAGAIATELRPQIKELADRAIRWIRNAENQQKVIHAFEEAGRAIKRVIDFIGDLVGALGGVKNTLRDLGLAWLAWKGVALGATFAVQTANVIAAGVVKTAWRTALISTGFGALAVAAGLAAEYVITHWEKVKGWFERFWEWLRITADETALAVVEPFSHLPRGLGKWARDLKVTLEADLKGLRDKADEGATAVGEAIADGIDKGTKKGKKPGRPGLPEYVPTPPKTDSSGLTKAQQAYIDRLSFNVEKAGATKTLADDLRALHRLEAYLRKLLRQHKNNLDLERQLFSVQQQEADLLKQRREAAKEAAERRRQRLETQLFSILGFGPGGAPKIPSLRQLRRQFAAMADELKHASPRLRREFANIAKVLERSFVPPNIRAKVREMLNGIRQELNKGVGGTPRGFTYNHPGVGGRSIAFAAAGVHVGTVNVYNTHNVGDLENQLTKRQAGRAHNRRGAR